MTRIIRALIDSALDREYRMAMTDRQHLPA